MARFSSALWFRVLALCIALGAGGGYVWMRQQKAAPAPPPAAGKLSSGIFPVTPVEGEVPDMEEVLMSSSKSGIIFEEAEGEEGGPRVMLPSSKLGVIPPEGIRIEPAPGPIQAGKPRRLLPGSKSIDGVLKGEDFISRDDLDRALEKRETGKEQKSQEP